MFEIMKKKIKKIAQYMGLYRVHRSELIPLVKLLFYLSLYNHTNSNLFFIVRTTGQSIPEELVSV